MLNFSTQLTSRVIILTVLALGINGCISSNSPKITKTTPSPEAVVITPTPTPSIEVKPTPPSRDPYAEAIDIATGAILLTKSAVIYEDWKVIADRWQEAVTYLKSVPSSSTNYKNAQQRIPQYQKLYQEALAKAKPPNAPKITTATGDISPSFFLVPIKKRLADIPVVEVTFNNSYTAEMMFDTGASHSLITESMAYNLGLEPIGFSSVAIADGSIVSLPVVSLKSISIDKRIIKNISVSVAPATMPIGLLGHDFFEGYDITIKTNVIEFRKN